eukprot:6486529-Amphidinium_carterae.1
MGVAAFWAGFIADILDGWTARKLKVGTKFGSYFDELADAQMNSLLHLSSYGRQLSMPFSTPLLPFCYGMLHPRSEPPRVTIT